MCLQPSLLTSELTEHHHHDGMQPMSLEITLRFIVRFTIQQRIEAQDVPCAGCCGASFSAPLHPSLVNFLIRARARSRPTTSIPILLPTAFVSRFSLFIPLDSRPCGLLLSL